MNDSAASASPPPASALPSGFFGSLEGILKHPGELLQDLLHHERRRAPIHLLLIIVASMIAFGLVLASFSGGWQWLWAPLKIAGGLLLSGLLCLPSLYVFGCLAGLAIRPASAALMLLAVLTLCGLIVVGFAPVAWIFAQSTDSIVFVGVLVFLMWVIALCFAFGLLKQAAQLLGVTAFEHIRIWMIVFVLVTLQMSTALRPILGSSPTVLPTERKFFVEHWLDQFEAGVPAWKGAGRSSSQR